MPKLLPTLLFLAAPGVLAAQQNRDFAWTGTLAAGQILEIRGINGGIVAEGTSGRNVEVRATKRGRDSDPATVTIEVVEHPDGVTICAVYPSRDESRPNRCEPGGGRRSGGASGSGSASTVSRVCSGPSR